MARAFTQKKGRFVARMNADEIGVVVHLLRLTRDFVGPESAATGDSLEDLMAHMDDPDARPAEPEDPALRRLLPSAHRTDADQAAEFRALTERSVRARKARTLDGAIDALTRATPPSVDLSYEQAQLLVVALTDVRLVLGERLGLRTDEDSTALHEELAAHGSAGAEGVDEERAQRAAYYDFLSWFQETLASALLDAR